MKQRGFSLIVSLIFLVVLTGLGLVMFGGFTTDQSIAANAREKSRAFDAAQGAINFAENWLAQPGNASIGVNCAVMVNVPQVCTNALASPSPWPWTVGINYTPAVISVNAAGGSNTYAANPVYYIQYLPANSTATTFYYQITAGAKGGNDNAFAVLQTVVRVDL